MLSFFVPGRPSPQGSKRSVGGGRFIEASKYLPAWRSAITETAREACQDQQWEILHGPVELQVAFYLQRPASISRTKRPEPIVPPDIDKLVRAIGDGISDAGGIWDDDSQIVKVVAWKRYADEMQTGAFIQIAPYDTPESLTY